MRSFKRKKSDSVFGKKIFSALFSFVILFLIVFLVISTTRIYQKRSDLGDQIKDKEEEIAELSEKIKNIGDFEKDDFDDDYHLEKIVREQLLLKKEGEEVIFITFPEREEKELEKEKEKNKLTSIKNIIIDKLKKFFDK